MEAAAFSLCLSLSLRDDRCWLAKVNISVEIPLIILHYYLLLLLFIICGYFLATIETHQRRSSDK
jgi:hypothetical protein